MCVVLLAKTLVFFNENKSVFVLEVTTFMALVALSNLEQQLRCVSVFEL